METHFEPKQQRKAVFDTVPWEDVHAIYEFEVEDMPVTLAANTDGESLHEEGVKKWNAVLMKD